MQMRQIFVFMLLTVLVASIAPSRVKPTKRRPKVPKPAVSSTDDEEPSPYIFTPGQHWTLNVWQWLKVTPQHAIYIREPHLPWYGNLIKWLRINVLFKPVF
ncbi:Hypothetical predicted protein [Cloeon dipterum]|uniref:Uncharacterized protein n=1 Tax=Cloeon dipterum TaxID=197152 RepID=A0A8S1C9W1_9INSE|nr:Hypothetical predicted protein [Cloeon dipterum]